MTITHSLASALTSRSSTKKLAAYAIVIYHEITQCYKLSLSPHRAPRSDGKTSFAFYKATSSPIPPDFALGLVPRMISWQHRHPSPNRVRMGHIPRSSSIPNHSCHMFETLLFIRSFRRTRPNAVGPQRAFCIQKPAKNF